MDKYVTHLGRLPAHARRGMIVNLVTAEFKKATETSNELYRQLTEEKAKAAALESDLDRLRNQLAQAREALALPPSGCECVASRIRELEQEVAGHLAATDHNLRVNRELRAERNDAVAALHAGNNRLEETLAANHRLAARVQELEAELAKVRDGGLHPDFLNRAIDLHDLLHEITEEDPHAVKFKVSNPAMTGHIIALSHALHDFHASPCPSNEG